MWLKSLPGFGIMLPSPQDSYIGNTTASQAVKAGSTPVSCSKRKDHPTGGLFFWSRGSRTHLNAGVRWTPARRRLDDDGSIISSTTGSCSAKCTPNGWSFLLEQRESNLSKCRCPVDTCPSAAQRRRLHNFFDDRILLLDSFHRRIRHNLALYSSTSYNHIRHSSTLLLGRFRFRGSPCLRYPVSKSHPFHL